MKALEEEASKRTLSSHYVVHGIRETCECKYTENRFIMFIIHMVSVLILILVSMLMDVPPIYSVSVCFGFSVIVSTLVYLTHTGTE